MYVWQWWVHGQTNYFCTVVQIILARVANVFLAVMGQWSHKMFLYSIANYGTIFFSLGGLLSHKTFVYTKFKVQNF